MASPFRVFRKHQKVLMAVAVVVAMFVFVIGDALFSYVGQTATGSRSPQATVVTWRGGSMSAQELEMLTQRRLFVSNFLERLRATGAQRVLAEGGNPVMPTVPDFVIPEQQDIRDVQTDVVSTRLMAEQARKAGIIVGDEVINHFLRETSFRRVGDEEIIALLAGSRRGGLSAVEQQLFSGLRELLLADHYRRGFSAAVRTVLPEERWEDWRRVNHRISVDAAVLPASAFVAQVPEPSDSELLAFYEQHKENVPGMAHYVMGVELPSPTPGFAEPRRVKLSYLMGDVDRKAEELLDTVTEEEIVEYYEENKETLFVKTTTAGDLRSFDDLFGDEPVGDEEQQVPPLEDLQDEPTDLEDEPVEETPAREPSVDESEAATEDEAAAIAEPSDEEVTTEETTTENGAAESDEPADGTAVTERDELFDDPQSSEEPAIDEHSSDESTSEEATGEEATTEDATSEQAGDDETSSLSRKGPFRLAALQENESGDAEDATSEDSASAEDAAPTEDTDLSEETNLSEEEAPAEDEDEESVEFIPLEDVRDSIRLRLATNKATAELSRILSREAAELRSVYNPYGFEVVAARSEGRDPPEPPEELTNLSQRAKESGLISEETVLLSARELMDTFVGRAIDSQTQRQTVAQAAFDSLHLFEPLLAEDLDGSLYLVLKTDDQPARVPDFEEVRDDVVAAWKRQEAQKLALEAAKEFAKECEESGESLDGFFTGKPYEVVTTDMFSWLTFGATPVEMQRGPRLSEAPPLEDVGPDFMAEAFQLESGDVAAVANYNGSHAYVIRLARRERTEQELRDLFLTEADSWYGANIMTFARMQNNELRLMERLAERMGLDLEMLDEYFAPRDDEY